MEAKSKRNLRPGTEYDRFFPKPNLQDNVRKRDADTQDTLGWMQTVVSLTLSHTARIAPILKGKNLDETCRNIWNFVYQHIDYVKDESGNEQVRRPARLWADRKGDCDCYATFISSILTNLNIAHVFRITKYSGGWQHIYPIVPKNGRIDRLLTDRSTYYVIDCVVDRYDYEVPFSQNHDSNMKLTDLSGIGNPNVEWTNITELPTMNYTYVNDSGQTIGVDVHGTMYELVEGDGGVGELGKTIFGKIIKGATSVVKKTVDTTFNVVNKIPGVKAVADKAGDVLRPAIRFFNRYLNPGTLLLRNGWLLSMKINLFHLAQKLRYAYYPYDQVARVIEITPDEYNKLVEAKTKAENTYVDFGGRASNLKKAILNGKGNHDNKVLPDNSPVTEVNDQEELQLVDNIANNSVSGLGEVTAVAITAVSGAVAALAATLGSVLKKEKPTKPVPTGDAKLDAIAEQAYQTSLKIYEANTAYTSIKDTFKETFSPLPAPSPSPAPSTQTNPYSQYPAVQANSAKATANAAAPTTEKESHTALIVGGVLATAAIVGAVVYSSRDKKRSKPVGGLSGTPKKRNKANGAPASKKPTTKKPIAKKPKVRSKAQFKGAPLT